MPPKKKQKRQINAYSHEKEERKNNPPVGLVSPQTDPDTDKTQSYTYDPHLDPQLHWSEKAERTSFEVPTVSLHVHERIAPRTIIEAVRKINGNSVKQGSLFDNEANIPLRHAIEFYKHSRDWSNRLIAGDSLLVMNSLLQKENMAGKVQCVYIDPPYGIKYGSNFQPHAGSREVKDGKDEDLTTEPEMIRAFRDTWELGIHSYLSYMRDRLLLAKELLSDSGSCFVQISDENVHHIRELMDEVFGAENFVAQITYKVTSGTERKTGPRRIENYLVWYAKSKEQCKFHRIYKEKSLDSIDFSHCKYIEHKGTVRLLTKTEREYPDKIPKNARIFHTTALYSARAGRSEPRKFDGETYSPPPNTQWRHTEELFSKMVEKGLIIKDGNRICSKYYLDNFPLEERSTFWVDTGPEFLKSYVVQTPEKPIQRCILMTTDPGDLVLDPTCGSGTTAYVAERWGRRWITCDTSRVAITLAKQRLMTATFDYYKLAYPDEGVGSGFEYKKVPRTTLRSIANDEPPATATLYDKPKQDTKKARVTGPFTVEAVPSPTVQPIVELPEPEPLPADITVARSGATLRHDEWCDELLKAGIRGKSGQRISFARIESWPGRWLHAEAETKPDESGEAKVSEPAPAYQPNRAFLSFGPEHGLLECRQVENAMQEASTIKPTPQMVIFVAFQFDPEAAKDIDETNWPGVSILKVQMNADLQTKDLKKKDSTSDSFWLVGQPDVELIRVDDLPGQWQVKVNGFDYFNTKTGELESGDKNKIAIWMLDTDYDGRSLYPKQVFMPMAGAKDGWAKLAKDLKAEIDTELIECYRGTLSLPFESGENSRIAVKIVDDRGIESLKVIEIPEDMK